MSKTSAAIDTARRILEARAKEVRAELKRVDNAVASLPSGVGRGTRAQATRTSARPPKEGDRSRRRSRRGARANQAVELVAMRPGITINELAEQMGLKGPHYLYRLMPRLEAQGRVVKRGEGFRVV